MPLSITFELAGGAVLADAAYDQAAAALLSDARQVLQTALVGLWRTGGAEIEVPWAAWVAAWEGDPPEAAVPRDGRLG
jgi:hypothetical protein